MKYKCPKCGFIFSGEEGHCPKCGLKLKYKPQDPKPENKDVKQEDTLLTNFINNQNQNKPNETIKLDQKPEQKPVDTQPVVPPTPTPTPTQPQKITNAGVAHNILALICAIVALGFFSSCLFITPFYSELVSGTGLFFSSLDYIVYIFTELGKATITFETHLVVLISTFFLVAVIGIGALMVLADFIISLINLIRKHQPTNRTPKFVVTPFMLFAILGLNMIYYLPQIVNGYTPIETGVIQYVDQLQMVYIYGAYVAYFIIRLIYNRERAKAI
ncbi:MAG: hypothetical protein K5925_02600 [Bacilli bacterium]|nr:hypothetical protein [Bacilli bacterium]